MKPLLIALLFLAGTVSAQQKTSSNPEEQIKQFWFVMLTSGPNRTHDTTTAKEIQRRHLANIDSLYYEGKIKVAGPFGGGDWRGLFIFDCPTKEEVESLLKTDAAISSGRLAYDIRPWWTAPIGSFAPGKPLR